LRGATKDAASDIAVETLSIDQVEDEIEGGADKEDTGSSAAAAQARSKRNQQKNESLNEREENEWRLKAPRQKM
jgi:hypothetical protein